jgi:hypothetical protein
MPDIDVGAYIGRLREVLPYVPPVSVKEIKRLHGRRDFGGVVKLIRSTMSVGVRLTLHWTSGPPPRHIPNAAAWISRPAKMPYYGTPAFADLTLDLFLLKDFAQTASYDQFAITIAHELSHVVLDSVEHPLRREEKAVDLTAMLLGFSRLYWVATEKVTGIYVKRRVRLGYLSDRELRTAVRLLVPLRERRIVIAKAFVPLGTLAAVLAIWIGVAKGTELWRLHQKLAMEAESAKRQTPQIVSPSLVLNDVQAGLLSIRRIYLLARPSRPDQRAVQREACAVYAANIRAGATYEYEYRNASGNVLDQISIASCP